MEYDDVYLVSLNMKDGGEPFIKKAFLNKDDAEAYLAELDKYRPGVPYFINTIAFNDERTSFEEFCKQEE